MYIIYTLISTLIIPSAQLAKLDPVIEALNIHLFLHYSLGGRCWKIHI